MVVVQARLPPPAVQVPRYEHCTAVCCDAGREESEGRPAARGRKMKIHGG
eukprot:COSAG01_NODE_18204_length_1093_cov_0.896378_1_plen_49_part_10